MVVDLIKIYHLMVVLAALLVVVSAAIAVLCRNCLLKKRNFKINNRFDFSNDLQVKRSQVKLVAFEISF